MGHFHVVHAAVRLAQQVVELRFFGGMTTEETAKVLGLAERTVHRRWAYAKAWLFQELKAGS